MIADVDAEFSLADLDGLADVFANEPDIAGCADDAFTDVPESAAVANDAFTVGDIVEVHGLIQAPQFNSRHGVLAAFAERL